MDIRNIALYFISILLIRSKAADKLLPEYIAKRIGYSATAILPPYGGTFPGNSLIISALSKVMVGKEKEAIEDLYQAVATFTNYILNDRFLYMVGKEAVDMIAHREEFKETREAMSNYNSALYSHLFELDERTGEKQTLTQMKKAMFFIEKAFSDALYKIPRKSKVTKMLKKIKTWAKKDDLAETMDFAFDVISLRVNLQLLREATDNHESEKFAAHCLGLCASIVGLENFIAAVVGEINILSENGVVTGTLMNIAVTYINIHEHGNEAGNQPPAKDNFESKSTMEALGEHSKKQLRRLMLFASNQNVGLNDIYVVNQGLLPKWGILYDEDKGPLQFGAFRNGSEGDFPLYRKEDSSDVFLVAGKPRRLLKAEQPKGDMEKDIIGFDFYGRFARGYPYKGSTIIIETENINTPSYKLNGFKVNTCLQKAWYYPNDYLLLTDLANMDRDEKIEIDMGKGDDVIVITGMLGNSSERLLRADLGSGINTLSFEGMDGNREDIKGVYFDSKEGKLSYFYGTDVQLHTLGIVKPVHVFIGSPFNDYIVLFGSAYGNPNGYNFVVIQYTGKNFYEIDLDQLMESSEKKQFKIIDNSNDEATIVVRTSKNITRNELIFTGNVFQVHKKKKRDTPVETIVSVHIISKDVPVIKIVDVNDNTILRDIRSNLLAPIFVNGLSMTTSGKPAVNGSEHNDVCVLQCRKNKKSVVSSPVVIDLGPGEDAVVIKDSTFLSPCGINSDDFKVWLEPNTEVVGDDEKNGEWFIKIERKRKVIMTYLLRNVEKILNAFGALIVNLENEKRKTADLLGTYITVTSHEIGLFK